MKQMKRFILYLIIALVSCSSKTTMKNEVKRILEDKYGEKFIVYYDSYNHVQKNYHFQAAPVKSEKLVFVGWHNEDFSEFKDQYLEKYISYLFGQYVKEEVEKYTEPSYIFSRITFNNEIYNYKKVNVDTLKVKPILDTASYISFDISCCLFKDINEQTKAELLTGLYHVIEPFKNHPNVHISLLL